MNTSASTTRATQSWNMSNTEFKNLGTISSSVNINGLNLNATSSKTMNVSASEATVEGSAFKYVLALEGSGTTQYRSLSFPITGTSTIKVTAKSGGSATRTLKIVSASGTELGSLSFSSTAALQSLKLTFSGTVYLYSADSGINIYKIQLDTDGVLPGDEGKTVTNFSDLVAAANAMASTGGVIYVNASRMSATGQLALKGTSGKAIAIIGVRQSDGTYPILDFSKFRSSTVGSTGSTLTASTDSHVGVRITGSNYTIRNLIIEKAPDNGIQIKGTSANYNTIDNCIVRYNNDSGVQITGGASYNTIRFVYSYRNCDVYTRGGNADGFSPKLGATTGNTFYGCYAWQNSDDGWDSYDKSAADATKDLSYEECACWDNGDGDIFTGKRDFDSGLALDTDLFLVELITKNSSTFATDYANGKFNLPTSSFINTDDGKINAAKWAGDSFGGNPNGFKYGSSYSTKSLIRTTKRCLSFNHKNKGFDNNNGACTGSFEKTVSFDNGRNYYIPLFTISKWQNVYGFNGAGSDGLPGGYSVSTPSNQSTIRSKVTATVNTIVNNCKKNIIPGEVYFDIY